MPSLAGVGAGLSIISGAKSLFGGSKTASAAGSSADAATMAAQTQAEVAAKQEERADESWVRFKEKFWPLQDAVVGDAMRGVKDRSEELAARAVGTVSDSFDQAQERSMRALDRYNLKPTMAMNRDLEMGRAAAVADTANVTRENERRRVEDTGWNRKLQALSLGQGMPAQVSAMSGQAGAASSRSAGIYTDLARMMAQDATSAGNAGMQLIRGGIDALGKNAFGTPPINPDSPAPGYVPSGGTAGDNVYDSNLQEFGEGGAVRGPSHERGGVPIEAEGGEYVLPADVVADLGLAKIDQMVEQARERAKARAGRNHAPKRGQ